jgi:hypothetical protein
MKTLFTILLLCIAILQGYSQLYTPLFTDAHLLSKGEFRSGLGYSALGYALKGDREGYLNSLDLQATFGLSQKVNLSLQYQHSWYASEMFHEWAMSFLFASANISLQEDRISLLLPVGTRFSGYSDDESYFEFSPTLIFRIPLTREITFNPAVEFGFPFCESCASAYVSADLGIGVYPTSRLSFYLEYALAYQLNSSESRHFYMLSLGVSYKFAGRKDSE